MCGVIRVWVCLGIVIGLVGLVPVASAQGGGEYDNLVALFLDFRELQKPVMVDWVPDYSVEAIAAQRVGLLEFQAQLREFDIRDWPISQKVEYHLVRAEMNGLDFYQRVLKPWARDPGFYLQTQDGGGPARAGHLEIYEMPIPEGDLAMVRGQLQAVPVILMQARANLTEGAADLAYCALHYMSVEIEYHRMLRDSIAEHHPGLLGDADAALAAVIDYGVWLIGNRGSMTAPAGVGKENYNWWMKNVQLMPYTWEEFYGIIMREDDRLLTTLALEKNRNRNEPALVPARSAAEHARRREEALVYANKFMEEEELFPIPDWVDMAGYLSGGDGSGAAWGSYFMNRYVGSGETGEWPGVRDFFHQTGDREPMPEQAHEFIGHAFDQQRDVRDDSPIRGAGRYYAIQMIRREGWGFWLEEMMMHAGYLDGRPARSREIAYEQGAFRTCRAIADLKMHSNEYSLQEAIDYAVDCAPNSWLIPDGPHAWYEMQTNLRYVGWHMGMVIGKLSINQMIAERVRQLGDAFSFKDFFEDFFSAGNIPLSLIRWQMTGLEDEMAVLLE